MKDLKIYTGIGATLLIIYLVALFNRPKAVDWSQTLINTDKIPFGTYVVYNRLHDIFPKAKIQTWREPVYNVLSDHGPQHGAYIIICDDINLNESDYEKLSKYIKAGNDVFIAAAYYGDTFKKNLKVETNTEYHLINASTKVKFCGKYVDTNKIYTADKNTGEGYFSNVDNTKCTLLGKNDLQHANFIKFNMGKGALYLNSNPLLFTNYSMLKDAGSGYPATALSYLNQDNDILWDEYYTQSREGDASTMRVFLRSPALRWSYYIALCGLTLYVLYQMKRRQRIIPIIEPLTNSTLSFVNVVGQVYYEQRDNANIAQKKAAYFLEHVRTKYYLKTTVLNEEFIQTLIQKSGADAGLVQQLLNQITIIRSGAHISDRDLISFNQNVEQFYIQSR